MKKLFTNGVGPPVAVAIAIAILAIGAPVTAAATTQSELAMLPTIENTGECVAKTVDTNPVVATMATPADQTVGNPRNVAGVIARIWPYDINNEANFANMADKTVGNQTSKANVKAATTLATNTPRGHLKVWPKNGHDLAANTTKKKVFVG